MAANSLLYLLLATGLSTPPTPPSVPVTTESPFEHGSVEKADQWPLSWAENEAKPRAQGIDWSQVSEDKTEDPLDQFKVKGDQWRLTWADNEDKPRDQGIDWSQVSEDKTEDPFDQYPEKRDQYPSKRDQYPSTRDQYPSSRDQYPSSRNQYPSSRDQYPSSRDQYPSSRDQYPSSRDQYPSSKDQYPSSRDQYPSSRDQYPSSRDQYPSSRDQYPSSRDQYPSSRDQFSDTKDYDRTEEADEVTPYWPGFADKSQNAGIIWPQNSEYKTEDPLDQFPVTGDYYRTEEAEEVTRYWPGFADKRRKLRPMSPQESEYKTEDPRDQFPITGDDVTQSSYDQEDQTAFWTEYEAKTQDPFDQFPVTGEENAEIWQQATEDPEQETARSLNSDKKKRPKRSCPRLEHRSLQCEKTCSNYKKPEPCPKKEKKTCVCDGGYVRNKHGKCVTRDNCEAGSQAAWNSQMHPQFWVQDDGETQMNTDDDSHGCPYTVVLCDMFCVAKGRTEGVCEENKCKCN